MLPWLQEQDTTIFCDFLRRWPTLKAAQLARRATLATFCRAPHVRSAAVIAQRLQAIKSATLLTTDDGVIAPHALLVQASSLSSGSPCRLSPMSTLARRAQSHPDFSLFQALPGAGPVFAPRLLVAFGEQRARSAAAAALQQ